MSRITEVKLVCDLLNGIDSPTNRHHPLYEKAIEIAQYISNYFGKIETAEDIENTFSSLGDMTISVKGKVYILELKKIESSNNGKGTLANTSQNIFSELKLIYEGMGWSQWREKSGYQKIILGLLRRYESNDNGLENDARNLRARVYSIADRFGLKKGSMASLIKNIKTNYLSELNGKEKLAVSITDEILIAAREDLSGYLNDCRKKGINTKNLKSMIALLKLGYHTLPLLKKMMREDIDQILRDSNYFIIYFYPGQHESSKRFKIEGPNEIKKWIQDRDTITAEIEGESLWVRSASTNILQFKFCWRNIFFGISTPSVEIFDKTNL